MPVANINGQTITYADSGGDGPAVLFSHGFLMDHTMFDAQVEALAGDYRCIAWDERGFGGTRPPSRSPTGTRPTMRWGSSITSASTRPCSLA